MFCKHGTESVHALSEDQKKKKNVSYTIWLQQNQILSYHIVQQNVGVNHNPTYCQLLSIYLIKHDEKIM